jgi:hypothetical protein
VNDVLAVPDIDHEVLHSAVVPVLLPRYRNLKLPTHRAIGNLEVLRVPSEDVSMKEAKLIDDNPHAANGCRRAGNNLDQPADPVPSKQLGHPQS